MNAFDAPHPTVFGIAQAGQTAGLKARKPLSRSAIRRKMLRLRSAREAIPHLPANGEALHGLMLGEFDLMSLVTIIVERLPGPLPHLCLATLGYSRKNLVEMLRLVDTRTVTRLSLVASNYFAKADKEVWQETCAEFKARGLALANPRSHCKVVTFHAADGTRLSLEGSANLRTNKNREQFCIVNDAALHDWHAEWIDETLASYAERNEGR
jgi:hypothetical protein